VRVIASFVTWFLFALCMTLLVLSTFTVMSLGGSCASGGPYVIAVPCPDSVAAFTPLSIIGGLVSVGLGFFFTAGFGMPLATWSWPILFCGLGGIFLLEFFATGDPTGLILGLMFEIMGLVPLVLEFRGSPQRVFIGQFTAGGVQFYEGERARRSLLSPRSPNPEGAVRPGVLHWVVALGLAIVGSFLGYQVAMMWFLSFAPAQ